MTNFLEKLLLNSGLPAPAIQAVVLALTLLLLAVIAYLVSKLTLHLMIPFFVRATTLSKSDWDDMLVKNRFFDPLVIIIPVLVIYAAAGILLEKYPFFAEMVRRLSMTILVFLAVRMLNSVLYTVEDIYKRSEISKRKPIGGYLSMVRIAMFILAGIFIVSTITDKSPWGIISVFGGLTAIVLLVFKDTILGFVASLQLVSNDMIRVGDWIEMPRFEADGEIIDVSIHTVKVQNWDMTITTIPTYALVSNAFKNWRGMAQADGRRIKKALLIDMNSISFCTPEKLEKYGRLVEFEKTSPDQQAASGPKPDDGKNSATDTRRHTNIGLFRAYLKNYLAGHPGINRKMTLLVRYLAPTAKGLPLEIYLFSSDKVWAHYEDIQAEILDHIIAILPEFDLRVFQEPSGFDLRHLRP